MLSLARTSQYSGRWSERQRVGKYGEKNLAARALQVEEMGAVSVGACREKVPSGPTGKEQLEGAHVVRMEDALRVYQ
jgi:hypothetical protein